VRDGGINKGPRFLTFPLVIMIASGSPPYSFRTGRPARKLRTLAATTGPCPFAFAACFCSFQSMISPTAKIAGWDDTCRVFSTLTSLVSVSTSGPRDFPMKSVFGLGPEVTTFTDIVTQFVQGTGWHGLTTRPALSFSPDLKTSSPEPEGGNSATNWPNTKFTFRAATPAFTRFLYFAGYASFNRLSCACTIVTFLS
jgi:hypothetical protein